MGGGTWVCCGGLIQIMDIPPDLDFMRFELLLDWDSDIGLGRDLDNQSTFFSMLQHLVIA
mgnify:CR=1 FL=1